MDKFGKLQAQQERETSSLLGENLRDGDAAPLL
ncbi:hypothetical protein PPTG_22760 [Phytophthora nicotianae INRA-310]|uniref:Uncharacterized protein n=2 Tax=Phytophthora nicotianae TaxID=4792 RepID=W2QBJ1_PHYN3|nr:hypothetical protein PPTG_22760 [Phytophthora nicotianae INRA-310]ETN10553.1 hypothetical protein PPTG_22760 [Phytophthora nicotianae INRA-310]ETO77083.1 hypothetical protein F444_07688 [Phytophthora nicotianae P1976]